MLSFFENATPSMSSQETDTEGALLYEGSTVRLYEVWQRTLDRYEEKVIPIDDGKVNVQLLDCITVTCRFFFATQDLNINPPCIQITCEESEQMTYRLQRWTNEYLKVKWPPKSRPEALAFLNTLLRSVQEYYENKNSFCAVCGVRLLQTGCRPMPCSTPLCIFAFEELDYADTLHSYSLDDPVLHLLIAFCYSTCATADAVRQTSMFSTLPSAFLSREKTLNWSHLVSGQVLGAGVR